MEFEISLFIIDSVSFATSIFLCFYVVKDRLKKPVKRIVWQMCLLLLVYLILSTVLIMNNIYSIQTIVCIIVCIIYYCRNVDEKITILIFILLLVATFSFFCDAFSSLLCDLTISSPVLDTYRYEDIPFYIVPTILFAILFGWWLRKLYLRLSAITDMHFIQVCVITGLFLLLYIMTIALESFELINGITSIVASMLITGCAFITFSQMVSALENAAEKTRASEKLRMIEAQVELQAERINDIKLHNEEIRRTRHDFRHQILTIHKLIDNKQYENAKKYADEYGQNIDDAVVPFICENPAVNALIQTYVELCQKNDISFEYTVHLPNNLTVKDSDLCVIIGNLLENAIEASEKLSCNRQIIMNIASEDERVMILVKNRFDGVVKQRDNVFLSTKHEGEGLGTASIMFISRKYDGYGEFSHEGMEFTSKVLLYLK